MKSFIDYSHELDDKENRKEEIESSGHTTGIINDGNEDDEYSNIRIFQLGSTNPLITESLKSPKSQFTYLKQQSASMPTTTHKLPSSGSLGFLLNWKHSFSSEQIDQLNDRLLITHQSDPMKSLINCIFTLNSKAS